MQIEWHLTIVLFNGNLRCSKQIVENSIFENDVWYIIFHVDDRTVKRHHGAFTLNHRNF